MLAIVVLAGPTATGKTALAVELTRALDGEVIGADSVQVYRGFDIGSAKPTAAELGGVAHHLLDVVDPDQPIDAVGYARIADRAIADVHARGRAPIVVGGTGLWLRALVRGLVEVPPVDPDVRARLDAEAERDGTPALHARLASVDPVTGAAVHPNDRVRIVRALEVFEQTGVPMGELRARHALGAPRYDALFMVVDVDRSLHGDAIGARTRAMIDAGLAGEVRALRARWGDGVRAFGSVGYRQMLEHVRDGVPIEETERRMVKATRLYARRQRTWFRSEPGVSWRARPDDLRSDETMARIAAHLGRQR